MTKTRADAMLWKGRNSIHQKKTETKIGGVESRGLALSRAGLGRREAQKQHSCAAERHQSSAAIFFAPGVIAGRVCGSIFTRHHHGDGGLRVVNVQCATSGDQFDEGGFVVSVADIQGDGDAVAT